jgi:Domain of unknown function (DUF4276)
MTFFEVLVEGSSDVPAVREVLTRRFGLREYEHFRIHPHQGRGNLPRDLLGQPDPRKRGLLDQLPAKLRGWSGLDRSVCVLVVVDVDDDPCADLLEQLDRMLERLPRRPKRVMFRLAIEETESWFIADSVAVKAAFPRADVKKLARIRADSIVGAAEWLARALGKDPDRMTGADKVSWACAIAPHLNLEEPPSSSLARLIRAVSRQLQRPEAGG